ncbi:putative ATP-dependent RNA helicase dhx40 [Desmophyllum pertusum]|uniref:ATP-dependent RNA helicase dhx40 n=1 Tax=Desmophyllum pertusum TaxID=174260 RepID=A0A9W9YGW6_9CNID|nr:putative ATP-dependent RNA helicase dhx40 [Desmophyllum pertusum]
MDGHGTQVYIHPSSTLFGCDGQFEWIIFHDVIWTSKIYVRTVCPIRYDWVRDLLPRLHEVDSYSLSGWAEGKLTDRKHEGASHDQQLETGSSAEAVKISKRSTEDSISAARQRFLERKRTRDQKQDT